jgi:cytochrome b
MLVTTHRKQHNPQGDLIMLTMSRRILYMVLGGIMALAVVGAAFVGGTAVFAQEETPAPPTTESVPSFPGNQVNKGRFRGQDDTYQELLAAELGISVEELEAAQEAVRATIQAQAVEDGLITQEQADLMDAAKALREYIDPEAIMADVLGLTTAELEAAREEGTVRDLIEASGLTQEEIMTAMQEAHETAVAQAVADGVITQEQADQLQEVHGFGLGGPRSGHGHGRGGPRGNGPRDGGANTAPTNPETDTADTSA